MLRHPFLFLTNWEFRGLISAIRHAAQELSDTWSSPLLDTQNSSKLLSRLFHFAGQFLKKAAGFGVWAVKKLLSCIE